MILVDKGGKCKLIDLMLLLIVGSKKKLKKFLEIKCFFKKKKLIAAVSNDAKS
jgi:hypothetical protein